MVLVPSAGNDLCDESAKPKECGELHNELLDW